MPRRLAAVAAATGGTRPLGAILQARQFTLSGHSLPSLATVHPRWQQFTPSDAPFPQAFGGEHHWSRKPTAPELRVMGYLAFLAGSPAGLGASNRSAHSE